MLQFDEVEDHARRELKDAVLAANLWYVRCQKAFAQGQRRMLARACEWIASQWGMHASYTAEELARALGALVIEEEWNGLPTPSEGNALAEVADLGPLLSDHDRLTRELREADSGYSLLCEEVDRQEAEVSDLRAKLREERAKADCGAVGPEPCRVEPPCMTCWALKHYREADDLRARLAELQRENERLKKETRNLAACGNCREEVAKAEAALAAERERRERLEKALAHYQRHSDGCDYGGGEEQCPGTPDFAPCRYHQAREALRPAAPSAQHVEMDEGESCSCGWTSHTKAWRAHAAHMRRRGETTSENSLHRSEQPDLPLGHEFEPCPSLMPDGFPARFCVLKSPKQTECHFWHLHPAHYCGQPESAHRRKP